VTNDKLETLMQSKHVLLGDGWITSLGHENQALPAQEVQAPYPGLSSLSQMATPLPPRSIRRPSFDLNALFVACGSWTATPLGHRLKLYRNGITLCMNSLMRLCPYISLDMCTTVLFRNVVRALRSHPINENNQIVDC
jgi:hypothetical protein